MRTRLRKELLTIAELATVANVHACTIRRAIGAGLRWYPGRGRQKLVSRADWLAWRGGGPPVPVTPSKVDQALAAGDVDELHVLRGQLLTLKGSAYTRLQAAGDELSPSQRACLAREFSAYGDSLRKLEAQLPQILYQKRRYVDAEAVGAILGRAAAIVAAELDGLGVSLAEKLVGMDARQIRDTIDDGVSRARGKLTDELQRLVDTKGN